MNDTGKLPVCFSLLNLRVLEIHSENIWGLYSSWRPSPAIAMMASNLFCPLLTLVYIKMSEALRFRCVFTTKFVTSYPRSTHRLWSCQKITRVCRLEGVEWVTKLTRQKTRTCSSPARASARSQALQRYLQRLEEPQWSQFKKSENDWKVVLHTVAMQMAIPVWLHRSNKSATAQGKCTTGICSTMCRRTMESPLMARVQTSTVLSKPNAWCLDVLKVLEVQRWPHGRKRIKIIKHGFKYHQKLIPETWRRLWSSDSVLSSRRGGTRAPGAPKAREKCLDQFQHSPGRKTPCGHRSGRTTGRRLYPGRPRPAEVEITAVNELWKYTHP